MPRIQPPLHHAVHGHHDHVLEVVDGIQSPLNKCFSFRTRSTNHGKSYIFRLIDSQEVISDVGLGSHVKPEEWNLVESEDWVPIHEEKACLSYK